MRGFRILWEEATDWRLAERDKMRRMLSHCPKRDACGQVGRHKWFGYLDVDDVDALHAELSARGADGTAPQDRPYGTREIVGTTIDGHQFVFGQQRNSGA